MNKKFPPKKPSNDIIKMSPKLEWSIYQKKLFKDIAQGEGHTIVEAYAGASKTTSIVESFKYIPRGKKAIALAFNKIIQEELRSRSPSYVDVLTFHSLGYRAIKQKFGNVEIEENKIFNILKDLLGEDAEYDLIINICDTVAYCKYSLQDTPSQIENIIDQFAIDLCELDRKTFIKYVIQALSKDKAMTNKIDFNDMCWFPFVYNLFLGQYHYVFVDECFPYDQCISTKNGKIKIGQIYNKFVKKQNLPLVKSYNELEDKFEYSKITNAWNRGFKNIFQVQCGKRKIKCTENHKFLTDSGWVEAKDLKPGCLIKTSEVLKLTSQNNGHLQYALNSDQHQIVLGSFLGDGHLNKISNYSYRLTVIHGEKQKEYCEWKASMFNSELKIIEKNGFANKTAYKFITKSFSIPQYSFPKNKINCPQWILDQLDGRGLAIWFMDDGSIDTKSNTARLWTSSFDEDSHQRFVNKLMSLGITCKVSSYFSKKRNKKFTYLSINKKGFDVLKEIISPYIHYNILYKMNGFSCKEKYNWNNQFPSHGYCAVNEVKNLNIKEEVYDIEVEKNHNFIVTSNITSKSTSGLIAHNCQDLNKSQLVMAKKVCTAGGRMIVVGDPNQAVYGWRFADSSIVQDLKKQSSSKILTLPISYRCPQKVINLAKYWVPDITCPSTAKEGEVEDISLNKLYSVAKPGCFILSRTNAPMIKICMQFIKMGLKANIRGRDVGKQLSFIIKKSKKKQIPAFLKWLDKWKEEEVERLQQKNINPENVLDRYECLVNLCEECDNLNEVEQKAIELFNDTDENNIIILSTVHRAKGLEREEVFILKWTLRQWLDENLKFVEKPNEEANIAYVAATRAKSKLYLVNKFSSIL